MDEEFKNKGLISQKRAGVLIPLFSVYSEKSFGIADFSDLKLAIDWVKESGNSILQLLPMNEMGPVFCPYDALSSFALEPVYISLSDLPIPKDKSIRRQIENLKKNLPLNRAYCDYAVKEEKMRVLREVFLMQGQGAPEGLLNFRRENEYWLPDFALFKVLKVSHNGLSWYAWPKEHRDRDEKSLKEFRARNIDKITFEEWTQWQLYEQFKRAKKHAAKQGVLLKGDLPILVSRDSSDVWAHPEFFKLEFAAGAPPDMYCALGQRWGMPTYNWKEIGSKGFIYLKEKLKYAQNFYDILRVDHVVGIFRIWGIPYNELLENKGLNGSFDPKDEYLWLGQGRKILKVMQDSCNMFLCAEDLGVVPQACTDTLKELNIPGNDVQRWVKDWNCRHDFLDKKEYRFMSVAMLSTHDTTNWAAWWENEAGTVDEALFIRKCSDHRGIGFDRVKGILFDPKRSRYGRLRWRNEIDTIDKLFKVLSPNGAIPKEHFLDFIDMWENTFKEKEKLWELLELPGDMREGCDSQISRSVLKFVLDANSLICINNIFDLLYPGEVLESEPYKYRINTPGTVSKTNWSVKIPIPLEDLLKHKVTRDIRDLVSESGRI